MPARENDEGYITRARELAATGDYASIRDIEQKLWEEGCSKPAALLESGWIREELYQLMAQPPKRER